MRSAVRPILRGLGLLLFSGLLGLPLVPSGRTAGPAAAPAVSRAWKERAFVVGQSQRQLIQTVRACGSSYSYDRVFERFVDQFQGTPYGAATAGMLRGFKEGKTLVNFESMDCVTFIENFLATALTCRQIDRMGAEPSDSRILELFLLNLEQVRYYGGQNCTWEDRIYYFTHALEELEAQGLLQDVGATAGQPFSKRINYLSLNKNKYPGITDWKRISAYEKRLSEASLNWFPLDRIDRYAAVARTGDVIALATDVKGLDVSHCGLVHVDEGSLYFTHASSIKKKVVYQQDLFDYLSKRTSITGIFVYRPNI